LSFASLELANPLQAIRREPRGVAELAADELGLVAFLRERKECLRARRGRPPSRHRLGSPALYHLITRCEA